MKKAALEMIEELDADIAFIEQRFPNTYLLVIDWKIAIAKKTILTELLKYSR